MVTSQVKERGIEPCCAIVKAIPFFSQLSLIFSSPVYQVSNTNYKCWSEEVDLFNRYAENSLTFTSVQVRNNGKGELITMVIKVFMTPGGRAISNAVLKTGRSISLLLTTVTKEYEKYEQLERGGLLVFHTRS